MQTPNRKIRDFLIFIQSNFTSQVIDDPKSGPVRVLRSGP